MKGQPRRGVDATLAVLATLTAAWPISTLLAEPTWLGGAILLLTVIALSGICARSFTVRGWQVLSVQMASTLLTASWLYGRGHLWHGLPSFETVGYAGQLVDQALNTVRAYAAPAPTTAGLTFVVGVALAVIGLAVDYLAVTRSSPSLAGLPLLVAFLAGAANSGSSLPVFFFAAAAGMWLVMVARQGSAIVRRWGTTVAVARTPVTTNFDSDGSHGYASVARALGVVALLAAVAMPVVLPQLPPHFLLSGLGRNAAGEGNGSGTVGFSLSLNLASDLNSRSTAPVLEYTTADPSPPPLRVAISSRYDSENGQWVPLARRPSALSANPDIPAPSGLSADVPRKRFVMAFGRNLLDEPHLAAPYPLTAADLGGVAWGLNNQTQDIRVARRPDSYTASYLRLEPTPAMLETMTAGGEGVTSDNDVALDDPAAETISKLSFRLTNGKNTAFDKAMAIQQYLRTGGFTYSLTLTRFKDAAGNDAGLDPLSNFLVTKSGYCVQFATSMVMLSRAAGIPARMAIGFLPGTNNKGVWSVTASDAHSWPELYLDGLGWTRFEPTPSRAAPPGWATPASIGGPAGGGRPVDRETAAPTRSTATRNERDPSAQSSTTADTGFWATSMVTWLTHGWGLVLVGSVIGGFGSLLVPAAARWRRRRELSAARTAAQRVEVEWKYLTTSLSDLGIAPAPSRTPRQIRFYYDTEAFLDGEASEALGRVVQTLELSRYGAVAPATDGLSKDARRVIAAAATTRRRRDRVRAALWPSSGMTQLRLAGVDLVWRARGPLRDAGVVLRQRFSRRR